MVDRYGAEVTVASIVVVGVVADAVGFEVEVASCAEVEHSRSLDGASACAVVAVVDDGVASSMDALAYYFAFVVRDVVVAAADVAADEVLWEAPGLTNDFGALWAQAPASLVAHDWWLMQWMLLLSKVAANGTSTLAPGAR